MSWNKLAPIAKSTGRPMASASVVHHKVLPPRIALILAASLKDDFGDPKKADVSAGADENLGMLLVEFTPDGAFDVGNFVHGGARIYVPVPEGVPDEFAVNSPCTLGERTATSVVVRLPLAAWEADVAGRQPCPAMARAETAVFAPPPPPKLGAGRQLDMVEYLAAKGVKISRLAENRFSVDGETLQFSAVLKLLNDKRKAADLDPLSSLQVR